MRQQMDHKITIARRIRRVGGPTLAAAAVIALAFGGYALAGTGGDQESLAPIGEANTTQSRQTEQRQEPEKNPGKDAAPTTEAADSPSEPVPDPATAYRECNLLVQAHHSEVRETTGKLAIENDLGVTVVVANDTDTFTCHLTSLDPGRESVGHAEALDGVAQGEDFWTGHSGVFEYANRWAGGQVPDGVTGISYDFGRGHTKKAEIQDGFWAMQYYSDEDFPDSEIEVTLDGPNGQTFTLPPHAICDQVNHGC